MPPEVQEVLEETPAPVKSTAGSVDPVHEQDDESHSSDTSENQWDALSETFDDADGFSEDDAEAKEPPVEDVLPAESQPIPEPEPEVSSEPVEKEETESPQDPAPVAEEAKEPEPEPEPEVAPEPEPVPQFTPEERQALRSQAVTQLTERYKLTKEETEEWDADPAAALPKLAATWAVDVYERVLNTVMEQIPNVVASQTKAEEVRQKTESSFYSEWPDLKPYPRQVEQIATMWRQMNPDANEETARKEIGRITMASLNITSQPSAPPSSAPPPPDALRQTAPPTRTTESPPSSNPFTALNEAWDSEDID